MNFAGPTIYNFEMDQKSPIFGGNSLLLWLSVLLSAGFFATTLLAYFVSRESIRTAIINQDLPLTSANIYSEIQKDLVRPILVSSTMAHDTFLRDWVLKGERNVPEMARYLNEVRQQYGAFTSYFVSNKTHNYYTGSGIFKRISENDPHDVWFAQTRAMGTDYQIDVDTDQVNRNALTIFINYKVSDFNGNFLGVTGIGLTVEAVRDLIEEYQARFRRNIYFVDATGRIVLSSGQSGLNSNLHDNEGIGSLIEEILARKSGSWQYLAGGDRHILHVNFLPELKWYLFVEQNEDMALAEIRRTLYINLAISLMISALIVAVARRSLQRYQAKIEELATTDNLTGLYNRHAFDIMSQRLLATIRREPRACSLLLLDVDHFKSINDQHGHGVGDELLTALGGVLSAAIRQTDLAVRWGGEEFLLVLPGCPLSEALEFAEKLRARISAAHLCPNMLEHTVTVSIGISEFDGGDSFDHSISLADHALYAAKRAGRNRVVLADGSGASISQCRV